MSIDLDAIKKRDDTQYGMECDNDAIGTTLQYALTDRNDLLREVARLRAEVERERTSVVGFLLEQQQEAVESDDNLDIGWVTKAIERGEHRREGEP
jgi:hypothetical protein